MTLQEECKLSYYKKIAEISSHKNVSLVQHVENKKVYVRKEQKVYNKDIYDYLKNSSNRHIPKIYECIEDEGTLIIIEEYIQGDSLQDIVRNHGVLPKNLGLQYMITLCDVLDELHSLPEPVIHRDLKPENIIIQEGGYLRLIDFNTAKKYDSTRESDTVIIGTKKYAAPEQYGFQQSDVRTDIYAIGVMLNYILAGEYPPAYIYGEDKKLKSLIEKCIAFDPGKRYQTVKELRLALQKVLKGEPLPLKEMNPEAGESSNVGEKDSWLPPGFRSKTPWKMLVAGFTYLFLAYCCFTMDITGADGTKAVGLELILNRIGAFGWLLVTIFYWFDYRGIQKRMPLTDKKWGKVLMGILIPLLFVVVVVIVIDWIC